MSPPGNLASRVSGLLGHTRVLAAVAVLALAGVLALTLLGGSDQPGGAASLQVHASVRNATQNDPRFAANAEGTAGNRVEYSLAAVNAGTATLSHVVLDFTPPSWGATLIRGSCRLKPPGEDFAACPQRSGDPELSTDRLAAGDRLQARVTYTLDPPPCRTPSVAAQAAADSAETALTTLATAAVRYTGLVAGGLPRCGTKLAQLLSAVPAPTRATCGEWPGVPPPALARVQCAPKQGAKYAVYILYRTPAVTAQVYRLVADRVRPRPCGAFRDGTGAVRGPGGSREVTCSQARGVAHLTWYDDGASVFAYADGKDREADPVLAWWRADG